MVAVTEKRTREEIDALVDVLVHTPSLMEPSMRNVQSTQLIFELSKPGRRAHLLPPCDVPSKDVQSLYPRSALRSAATKTA